VGAGGTVAIDRSLDEFMAEAFQTGRTTCEPMRAVARVAYGRGVDVTSAFDPSDPEFQQDPYPVLNRIREHTPLFWNETSKQWTVTRFDLVHALLRDRRLGRSYAHVATDEEMGRAGTASVWADFEASERFSLLNLEPPDHTRIRSLLAKVFTPSSVAKLRPFLEQRSASLLDRACEAPSIDLLRDYAMPYSIEAICRLLGVPVADSDALLDWSHAIVKMYELAVSPDQHLAADRAARDFIGYTRELIAAKRRTPDGSLVSELVQVEDGGDRLSEDEIVCTVIVLLNAGHEATVNVHGNGMRGLLHHPDEWRRVQAGEVTLRSAIEEMIRWDAPLQLFERFVLDRNGIEVAGTVIGFGSEIAMLFGSANRDPRRFHDGDRFDVGRDDPGHIGFGGGVHFCIGAPLARLELEVSLDHLRRHRIGLVREPRYAPTFVLHGLTELRVEVAPA
jgi:cytochrome P450